MDKNVGRMLLGTAAVVVSMIGAGLGGGLAGKGLALFLNERGFF